jgi:hypothetical protein
MMLRIVSVAAASIIACSHARAAEKSMPINFIGEWCFSSQEGATTSYQLPSWTDGTCTKILSVEQYSFYGEDIRCGPVVNMRLRTVTAPSGNEYTATVTASCQPDGSTARKLQTFEISRYKGNLSVTRK